MREIALDVLVSWAVCDDEVKAGEEQRPMCLLRVQSLAVPEVLKIAMISDEGFVPSSQCLH